jgi:hypothetical protein
MQQKLPLFDVGAGVMAAFFRPEALTVTNKPNALIRMSAGRLISITKEALRVDDPYHLGVGNQHPHRI